MAHPLGPLDPAELAAAVTAARAPDNLPDGCSLRFNSVSLKEPPKAALLEFMHGGAEPARTAALVLQLPPSQTAIEAAVELSGNGRTTAAVTSWQKVKGVQPLLTPDDCFAAEAICKADEAVRKLLAARGITDLGLVVCDPWSVHLPPKHLKSGGRLIQTFMYRHKVSHDNAYARPLDFTPVIDLNLEKVVHIDKPYDDAIPPLLDGDSNYHRELLPKERPWRTDLKPLNVLQPEGPSFTVDGNLVCWQKWQLRLGFNFKEGLVLHNVGYNDAGALRPIIHRASLVEMIVPYGDPNPPYERKCALDVGDYGLGYCANSLELGCDCLGTIQYWDAHFVDSKGEPFTIKKAVCLHEEDAGMMWKHTEYRTGHAEVRRSRRLVVSFVATVVNYEYAFYWYLYQDGTIKYEIKLTGELSTNLLSPGEGEEPKWGTLVAPRVNAQVHQHLFCMRLDMAVDDPHGGKGLAVSEINFESMPEGPENPHGNGFWVKETVFETEHQAQRTSNPASGRAWKISNPASLHPVTGKPVAYKLVPASSPTMLASPGSVIAKRGGFAAKNLWVTPYSEDERFPSGEHVPMSEGEEGLPKWTQQDRHIGPGSDPVIWHSFGVSHLPRPEDYPVMPVEAVGFSLKAHGFFARGNDAVDITHAPNTASKLVCCNGRSGSSAADGLPQNGH